jgi:hypothetical protein
MGEASGPFPVSAVLRSFENKNPSKRVYSLPYKTTEFSFNGIEMLSFLK